MLRDLPELLGAIEQADRATLYQALGLHVTYRRVGAVEQARLRHRVPWTWSVSVCEVLKNPWYQLCEAWTWSVSEGQVTQNPSGGYSLWTGEAS